MKRHHYVLFRILTSTIFLYAGIGHLFKANKILNKLSTTHFYQMMPERSMAVFLIYVSGVVMVVAGLMLAAGWYERKAAIALLLALIPITLSVQLENLMDLGPFFKNVAIAGSLLFIINNKSHEKETPVAGSSNTYN